MSAEASPRRGVKDSATLGYASVRSMCSRTDASWPACLSSAMAASRTGRTTARNRSPHSRRLGSSSSGLSAGWTLGARSAYAWSSARNFAVCASVIVSCGYAPPPGTGLPCRHEVVLSRDNLPTPAPAPAPAPPDPSVREPVPAMERSGEPASTDDEPSGDDRGGTEPMDLHVLVVRRLDGVRSRRDIVQYVVTTDRSVVLRVHEALGQ